MKNRNPLTKHALLFAVLLTFGAATARANVLPLASISFAPVGLTMDQTARLNLVNVGVPNGMLIHWSFIDANGFPIAGSTETLPLGQIVSFDFRRHGDPQLRAEVRAQVDTFTSGSLRASLEVFNNHTGATTVFMGGATP